MIASFGSGGGMFERHERSPSFARGAVSQKREALEG